MGHVDDPRKNDIEKERFTSAKSFSHRGHGSDSHGLHNSALGEEEASQTFEALGANSWGASLWTNYGERDRNYKAWK